VVSSYQLSQSAVTSANKVQIVTSAGVAVDTFVGGFAPPTATQTTTTKTNGIAGTAVTAATGVLIHTTTADSTYWVTSIGVGAVANNAFRVEFRDGTLISGTLRVTMSLFNDGTGAVYWSQMTFPNPVEFATGVFVDTSSTVTIVWTIHGWEELD